LLRSSSSGALYNGEGTGEKLFLTGEDWKEFESSEFRLRYAALLIKQNETYLETLKPDINTIIEQVNRLIPVYSGLAKQAGTLSNQAKQNKLTLALVQESITVLLNSLKGRN